MGLKLQPNERLLILDVDETLVHSIEKEPLPRGADFVVCGDIYVHKRPGLEKFFSRVSAVYRIGFWSAGGRDYVHAVLANIVPASVAPEFIWTAERCTRRADYHRGDSYAIKDLNKLRRKGYDLAQIVIADDDHRTALRNYGNLIPMRPFEGDLSDNELEYLADYLLSIRDLANFRTLEKRGWRSSNLTEKKVG